MGKLPGWVVGNQESVRREAEPFRRLTPEERGQAMAAACRAAARLLAARGDRARVLALRDELPASTVEALRMLRERGRGGHGRR